jgi:hypothetical protein
LIQECIDLKISDTVSHPKGCPSSIAKAICHLPWPIRLYKAKFNKGVLNGNEPANALTKQSFTTYPDVASIKTTGPDENTFYNTFWLAKEDHQLIQT